MEKITDPVQFTCTYQVKLGNLSLGHKELSEQLEPFGCVVAINSNFSHKALPGYEKYLKSAEKSIRNKSQTGRKRKLQGDGSCFNTCAELVIILGEDIREDPPEGFKDHYKVRTFPTTGQTQITGIKHPELEDGKYIAKILAEWFTNSAIGLKDPSLPVQIESERAILRNFGFHIVWESSDMFLNLDCLYTFINDLRAKSSIDEETGPGESSSTIEKNEPIPYPIVAVKNPEDSGDMHIRFKIPERPGNGVLLKIFRSGKFNMLNGGEIQTVKNIYNFIKEELLLHEKSFTSTKPKLISTSEDEEESSSPQEDS